MIWDKSFRGKGRATFCGFRLYSPHYSRVATVFVLLAATAIPSQGRGKKAALQYGAGLIVNVPLPEPEVAQAVEDVVQNTIIRGTKEYNRDEYITGAAVATSAPGFPAWKQGGKVFYKVRKQALDPLNFKNSGDLGTLAVRYVVQPQGDRNTILRIDAVFVEDFREIAHQSNGSVESSEYRNIQDHLAAVELMKKETDDALEAKQERAEKQKSEMASKADAAPGDPTAQVEITNRESTNGEGNAGQSLPAPAPQQSPGIPISETPEPSAYQQPGESLEQHVAQLRRQVERLVKKPGAPLQSAPFHTATTLKSLEPGTEVLILISTAYWYGVETRDGQHGWIRRDQLEQAP